MRVCPFGIGPATASSRSVATTSLRDALVSIDADKGSVVLLSLMWSSAPLIPVQLTWSTDQTLATPPRHYVSGV
jgi:hypothetical protein